MAASRPWVTTSTNRPLVINEAEAAVVRRIFEEMLTIGSPNPDRRQPDADGITTKAWTTQEGRPAAARASTRSTCTNCANRIYLGELSIKETGTPALTRRSSTRAWDKVHAVLARDGHARSVETKIRSRTDALLRGLGCTHPIGERIPDLFAQERAQVPLPCVQVGKRASGAPGVTSATCHLRSRLRWARSARC